jgi:hypothetical protein
MEMKGARKHKKTPKSPFSFGERFCKGGSARHLEKRFISLKEFMQESSRTFSLFNKA